MMLEDLHTNGKEEYMSAVGLLMLFKRSRGQLTGGKDVRGSVRRRTIKVHAQEVIAEIIVSRVPSTNYAEILKMWDLRNGKKDDQLEFDGFYDGFLDQVIW